EGLITFGRGDHTDLVILDYRMPGQTGVEVLEEILQRKPEARVIIASAFGTLDLALEAIEAGATDFLRKPFTTDILRTAVEAVLTKVQ
ncbi:response regulator, partial [Acinetobacter baumannii]